MKDVTDDIYESILFFNVDILKSNSEIFEPVHKVKYEHKLIYGDRIIKFVCILFFSKMNLKQNELGQLTEIFGNKGKGNLLIEQMTWQY